MGLDMHLNGEKHLFGDYEHPENDIKEDGFTLKRKVFEVGYWRKHPNLHGFIVQTFANGEDECQKIELSAKDIKALITAIEKGDLPNTTGFFFGASDGSDEEKMEDLKIFHLALEWLAAEENKEARSIFYQASW